MDMDPVQNLSPNGSIRDQISANKGMSRDASSINFLCPEDSTLHCLCALILQHIHESFEMGYQPPTQYSIFNSRDHFVPLVVSDIPALLFSFAL
jgi:phosphatidylethanolamine-binding protein (PEBP) family uncharacterized protein